MAACQPGKPRINRYLLLVGKLERIVFFLFVLILFAIRMLFLLLFFVVRLVTP